MKPLLAVSDPLASADVVWVGAAKPAAQADQAAAQGADTRSDQNNDALTISNADIVCATTHAVEPVVRRQWVAPGTHITSVGHNPAGREIDDETIVDSLVCVESRRAALAPPPAGSNDLVEPISTGKMGPDHIHAELGELVAGTKAGRVSENQITLYKSAGVAVQDAVAAMLALEAARDAGAGQEVMV